jgi:DNA-binding MurR/RpiR family transcriptional regulator
MTLKEVIAYQNDNLSSTDKQIIQELLSNPMVTAFLSAAEIAERVGVHESTVVRLAKKLGYSGYKELRNDLHEEIAPAQRVRRTLQNSSELSILVDKEIFALQALVSAIPQSKLDEVAQYMIQSQRIFLFAHGHSTALVDFMDRRLRRSGYNTVVLPSQSRDLAEHLVTLDSQDLVIGFAFRKNPPGLSRLFSLANKRDAKCILISDMLGVVFRPQPNILLAASRGEDDRFLTLTIPMVICNALILSMARLDNGYSIQKLDQVSDLIHFFKLDDQN